MMNTTSNRTRCRRGLLHLAAIVIGATAMLALAMPQPVGAEEGEEAAAAEPATRLTVEGAASRRVFVDGTLARFTVSALMPTVQEAAQLGNAAVQQIADEVTAHCAWTLPQGENRDTVTTCVLGNGLQSEGLRISEEFDWTEEGRVSQGFRYEHRLRIDILGTEAAGELVDLVIAAGGDQVRLDGIEFTRSRLAAEARFALLVAIQDAQATADLIAELLNYEIVRIVEIRPLGSRIAIDELPTTVMQPGESDFVPTAVFGGAASVTARVELTFELRPVSGGGQE